MPKITRHGGPSIAGARLIGGVWTEDAGREEWPDLDGEGGEEPSPGSSSSTSDGTPPTSPETSKPDPPKRARTTGSRSKAARTGGSSARSTAGDPE